MSLNLDRLADYRILVIKGWDPGNACRVSLASLHTLSSASEAVRVSVSSAYTRVFASCSWSASTSLKTEPQICRGTEICSYVKWLTPKRSPENS